MATGNAATAKDYRVVEIKKVQIEGRFELSFKDCGTGLSLRIEDAIRFGLRGVLPGDKLAVKGKTGNEDSDLWGVDSIEDIKLA